VQALLPAAALLVAGAAQTVNVVTHRSAHAKVAVAALQSAGSAPSGKIVIRSRQPAQQT
jgi:hypothetical protein